MKLKRIADYIGGELIGNGEIAIEGINGIKEAKEGELSFILNNRFASLLDETRASCVIVPKAIEKAQRPIIRTDNPVTSLSKAAELLLPDRIFRPKGIHKTVILEKNGKLGKNVAVGAYCIIEGCVSIGDETVIYPFSYIGKDTKIGKNCTIYPNVTVREGISIGDRVIIHSGTVIGNDGFGYEFIEGAHHKIPQLGTVLIEDDVEIGANVAIDRATLSKTVIGQGTKIDNLVQIAHNITIGKHCVIAAMTGIGGSSRVGNYVTMGGQVGLTDHIELGDNVMVGAQAGVTKSIPANSVLWGTPAKPMKLIKKLNAYFDLLPKLYERVNKLEKKVKDLENK